MKTFRTPIALIVLFIIGLGTLEAAITRCGDEETAQRQAGPTQTPTPGPACVTFKDVSTVVTRNCLGCHPTFRSYAVAKGFATEWARRVRLVRDIDQMPPTGDRISVVDQNLLAKWAIDGAPEKECGSSAPAPVRPARLTGDEQQSLLHAFLARLDTETRKNMACVSYVGLDDLELGKFAVAKALNSISGQRALARPREIGNGDAVGCYDLRDLALSRIDYNLVDTLGSVDNVRFITPDGLQNQADTGSRTPILRADSVILAVLDPPTYRKLTKQPRSLAQLESRLGVDIAGDAKSFRLSLVGFQGSQSGPTGSKVAFHNRGALRTTGRDGAYHRTDDYRADLATENIFAFPLRDLFRRLPNGKNNTPAGGEIIFELPNGLHGFAIANAANVLIDEVPTDIATDYSRPDVRGAAGATGAVLLARGCITCHLPGILTLPADQVRVASLQNPSLSKDDLDTVLALYRTDVAQAYTGDQAHYAAALAPLGSSAVEPVGKVIADNELVGVDLRKLALETGVTEGELGRCIPRDALLQTNLSSVLTGGTVARSVLKQNFKLLSDVCKLGQEALNPGQ